MNERLLSVLVLLSVVAGASACSPGEFDLAVARQRAQDRDLIVVTLDTTRWDHLGCYGYERRTSPVIDAFAHGGTRFEHAYAVTPVTLPSHGTIFTGLDPSGHGARNNGTYVLPAEVYTLAEAMQESGRTTAAFVSAFVLDEQFGLAQGFDLYDDDLGGGGKATEFDIETRDAGATVDAALAWLRDRSRDEKLFVWLHFFDPHAPYTKTPERERLFGSGTEDLYDGEIHAMDAALGRFRDAVKSQGREPIWIILADHGEGLKQEHGDYNEPAHGVFLYEETVRIPLIFHGEGIFPPVVSRTRARQADILPSVLDLLGLELPGNLDGESLLGALDGDEAREVYLETLLPAEDYGWSPLHALLQDDWKYVQAPLPELYDLGSDPRELDNLLHQQQARAAELKRRLQRLVARRSRNVVRVSLDGASIDRLRALGYVAGGGLGGEPDDLPDPKLMMKNDFNIQYKLDESRTLFARGRPVEACDILEKIVELNPENGEGLRLLGWEPLRAVRAAQFNGQKHPAEDRLLRASERAFDLFREHAPEFPDGEFGAGNIKQLQGDIDGAMVHYDKVLDAHPNHRAVLETVMVIHGARRDLVAFTEFAERLIELEPTHFQANFQLGALHKSRGEFAAALKRLEVIAQGAGDRSVVHFYMGDCYRELGDCPNAVKSYRQVTNPGLRAQYRVDSLQTGCGTQEER